MASSSTSGLEPVFPDTIDLKVPVPQKSGRNSELHVEDSGPSDASLTFLCLPGLGDFRQQYRFLGPLLRKKGFRVLVADLRGHGESSADFDSYTPLDISSDVGAILEAANVSGNVVLVGNSLAAASVLHFAAIHSEKVAGVACLGPVARDLPQDERTKPLTYFLFCVPWGPTLWTNFFDTMFKKHKPDDLKEYEAAMRVKLWEKGRLTALAQMARATKNNCFQEADKVKCPVLLIFGDCDPDFTSPAEEGEHVKRALTAAKPVQVEMLSGLGHYPHVEDSEKCAHLLASFAEDNLR